MRPRLLLLLLLLTPHVRADEWWAWSSLEFWRDDTRRAWLFLGNRLDADDGAYVQIASPRYRQALTPWLDGGLGLSLLSIENTRTQDRHLQFRPELELNPRLDLGPHLTLELRNRMEWRWNEEEAPTTHRTRHRLQLAWALPRPLGPLTRLFANNEWLIDTHLRQRTENRLIPLGLTFQSGPQAEIDLFYMVLSRRVNAAWEHESILGTWLRLRF